MVSLGSKLKENDIKIGEIYPRELIDFYCKEYDCALIKLNSASDDGKRKYMVNQIIDDVDMHINKEFNSYSAYKKKAIIIERA